MAIRMVRMGDPAATFGVQSPDDRLDYAFDAFLIAGEALLSPLVAGSPAGLTVSAGTVENGRVTFWVQGGAVGTKYVISCLVATSFDAMIVGVATLFIGPVGLDDPSIVAPFG